MLGIDRKVALVTGAAQGIGAAVCAALADAGARVAAADVCFPADSPGAADERTAVRRYPLDVRDDQEAEAVVARVEAEMGPIGILVNVAGVLYPGTVLATGAQEWRETFAVNVDGVFTMSRAVAGRMVPRRSGVVVTVASNAAGVPRIGMAAYAASKAAAVMLTKCLGLELASYGIRCNVVSPGSTDTGMLRRLDAGDAVAGAPDLFRVGIPLGRVASPGDIADAVVFLASDHARHITMHDLYVDGGATLRA